MKAIFILLAILQCVQCSKRQMPYAFLVVCSGKNSGWEDAWGVLFEGMLQLDEHDSSVEGGS